MQGRSIISVALLLAAANAAWGATRLEQYEKLNGDYEVASKSYYSKSFPENATADEKIAHFKASPILSYVPQFLKLAEEQPDDEAAHKGCEWIIHRMGNLGNWHRTMYDADEKAWNMIAEHQVRNLTDSNYQLTCLEAVSYVGRAREKFLRTERNRIESSREERAIATLALAELLSKKFELAGLREQQKATNDYEKFLQSQSSPDWLKDCTTENGPNFKAESVALFRELLEHDADVPVTVSAPYFRDLKTIGDKASKSLHSLEHLSVGGEAPPIVGHDLEGKPLQLSDFRGKTVLLVFWDTGCGPCMAMIPQEQALLAKYRGKPFAMLAVCTDPNVELGRATAKKQGMEWPCWFDGDAGQIVRDYNVLSWPTIYLLDEHGIIVGKDLRGDELNEKIAVLMADRSRTVQGQ